MTHEKRPELESDENQREAKSANLRERVEALQEKVSTLNEALDDAQQTLREVSDGSGKGGSRR
jgi:prefoldin subunit 5